MNEKGPEASNLGQFPTPDSVVFERILPGPIDLVWGYLTDPERMSRWLAGGLVDLRPGGMVELDFDLIRCPGRENMHGTISGIITAFDPPRLLAYTWNEGGRLADPLNTSIVTFELEAIGEETRLRLTHTRIRRDELSGIAAGWHVHLDVLGHRIANTEPEHFEIRWTALDPEYRALL